MQFHENVASFRSSMPSLVQQQPVFRSLTTSGRLLLLHILCTSCQNRFLLWRHVAVQGGENGTVATEKDHVSFQYGHHIYGQFSPQATVSYFVLALSLSPHRQNSHGIGAIANVQNARRLVAHPTPSALYICKLKSGNTAESV